MKPFIEDLPVLRGDEFFMKMAGRPPFTHLHPSVAAFFKDYLSHEKAIPFQGRYVVNTHFPPFPSPAFDNLAAQFGALGEIHDRSLYSVTLAVTNRCGYHCWHCYNAGRDQHDMPLDVLIDIARQLQELRAVRVTLSGGEPLLRTDLEDIAAAFDDTTYLNLNTTGAGLSLSRARTLHESGIFAAGISIDSTDPAEHDRLRGRKGAFTTALKALDHAARGGLYPYIVTVATHDLFNNDCLMSFLSFAADAGAKEVHLLEPCATGALAGNRDALLTADEEQTIIEYQKEVAADMDLPVFSSFRYLESPEAFGCGAGITHLYIDGSGEVSPCNLLPLSFGNIREEPLIDILDRMGECFSRPRTHCAGQTLSKYISGDRLPLQPEESRIICDRHLPEEHDVPRFFTIISKTKEDTVGVGELKSAYDTIHTYYNDFWISEAGVPVIDLIESLNLNGNESVLEAGCGTGFATMRIAQRLSDPAQLTAVDLSGGMLAEARNFAAMAGMDGIRFIEGDALDVMRKGGQYDLIFTSWVLGYIPLKPFFKAAYNILRDGGRLAFIVHRDHSPREPLDIFGELVAGNPSVLQKRVAFDFPKDKEHVEHVLTDAGLLNADVYEGVVTFRYDTPRDVLEHLLKSGAGTAYYDAVAPAERASMEDEFVSCLAKRHPDGGPFTVSHDFVAGVAGK